MMKTLAIHLLFVAIALGGGTLIGLNNMPGEWYQGLAKPAFNPPGWIFGPVWSGLYILIGIAGARTFISAPRSGAMKLWIIQMGLNFLWSPLFFGLHSPGLALIVIVALLVAIIAFVARQWKDDRPAALMFIPYVLWVGFASVLNAAIFFLN